jgi:NADPH-dependent 2,4-dienoyl-CoA reductase/sulfur reductase-like enzyme
MIDPDRDAPCDRPNLSKDYLAGNAPEEWIALHPPEFYDERQIEIVRTRAEAIIVADRTVVLGNGSRRRFDALILATGAEPVHLDIPASEGARVFYLRTLADSRAIIAAAQNGSRAVVIGAGFIGLEVAASLRHRNIDVHVVAMENVPLARVLGPELGSFVLHTHEEHGVTFHGGHTVHEIDAVGVTLDDGTRLDADFVVIGAGVRPRVALAESAGIRVDNGITVDEHLRTNVDGIFAAGDVASWPDPRSGRRVRIEHWAVAQMMGQTAARNVLGMNERFDTVPFFWSQHYDAVISSVGHAPEWDRADIDVDPSQLDCTVTLRQRGRRLAVVTIFRDGASLEAEIEMQREVRNPA